MTLDPTIYVDLDDTEDLDLGDGYTAQLRKDVDFETDERLTSNLAPVSFDLETGQPTVGNVDIARANLDLVGAYLVSITKPDGERVEVAEPGRIRRDWGGAIATHLRAKREGDQSGKGS